jgi:diguanylate cyclase (GGDEF)-like protein/PAS domain S-box-containing protein
MDDTVYRTLFDLATDCLMVLDLNGNIRDINRTGHERLGYTKEEMIGMHITQLDPPEFSVKVPKRLDDIEKNGMAIFESAHRRKNGGQPMPVEINTRIIELRGEKLIFSVIRDISERKTAEQRIEHLAHFDILTNLPNRILFYDRLDQAVARAKRYRQKFAVLFLDLDGFKLVNDECGHHIGDGILQMAAERMQHCVRDMDTIARIGGDEFVFILDNISGESDAVVVADKLLQTLAEPFIHKDCECKIGGSIGIVIYPDDTTDLEALVTMADDAMYLAKNSGKNTYRFHKAA